MKYKIIKTTCGAEVKVDADDYDKLIRFTWHINSDGYASNSQYLGGGRKNAKHRTNRMHRVIMKARKGQIIDHINRDRLDNRKENLRFVSRSENTLNRGPNRNNTSGFKGVYWREDVGKWLARITFQRKSYCIGFYEDKNEAALAYNKKALEFFGEEAYLNEIKESV